MAYNTIGAAMLVYGDDRGRVHLERSLALAREADLHEMAGLGLRATSARRAARSTGSPMPTAISTAGIAYTAERDLDASQHYMQSWLALTRLYQGRWTRGGRHRRSALVEREHVGTISRIMALVALGRLRARRGDPGVSAVLDEALELANRTQTLQRLAPVRAARAEAAWLAGDRAGTIAEARAAWDLAVRASARVAHGRAGILALARRRPRSACRRGRRGRSPCRLAATGERAAAAWERLGCPVRAGAGARRRRRARAAGRRSGLRPARRPAGPRAPATAAARRRRAPGSRAARGRAPATIHSASPRARRRSRRFWPRP